jgi:hypothetical protein
VQNSSLPFISLPPLEKLFLYFFFLLLSPLLALQREYEREIYENIYK